MGLAGTGRTVEEYRARQGMETAPEKVQYLLVFPSGDKIFEGSSGGGRLRGAVGRMAAPYGNCIARPVIEYFPRADSFPHGFFEYRAPVRREPAEEKFVGEMDGETA